VDVRAAVEPVPKILRDYLAPSIFGLRVLYIMQTSIKYTAEAPHGVKAGLKRTYGFISQDLIDVMSISCRT